MKLEEIERICSEATEGPWEDDFIPLKAIRIMNYSDNMSKNIEFIAMARNKMEKFCKLLRAAKKFNSVPAIALKDETIKARMIFHKELMEAIQEVESDESC